jgi:hypothetical protein
VVNQTLRGLFQQWKTEINSLNNTVSGTLTTDEEFFFIDKAITSYT